MTVEPAEIARAEEALERARERVRAVGEDELRQVADAHGTLTGLFDRYEADATGDGDFQAFIEFQEELANFVERLPEDLRRREAFEEVDDLLQQRRLSESDFADAREALSPVEEDVALLENRDALERRRREVRERARRRIRELEDHIADLESLRELGEADLDAPVEELREPIEAYNDAVSGAFAGFKRERPARRVLGFVADASAYPLVDYETPPAELVEYVETHPAGAEPIPELLEYAEYSRSKLAHYVEDADALGRAVGTRRTYLRRLDASPLRVSWPPPPAGRLRFRVRELVSVTGRFAPEAVVARVRSLRGLADDDAYGRLRGSAVARSEVSEADRKRLKRGEVAEDLAAARAERDALREALEDG